jgi:predicted NUDIX family NTP pyrophosphohydrolase
MATTETIAVPKRITNAQVKPQTIEVERAEWFSLQNLPAGLPQDQRLLIERATSYGANGRD